MQSGPSIEFEPFVKSGANSDLVAGLVLSSRACLQLVDVSGRIVAMNPPGYALMEFDELASICGMSWSDLWPKAAQSQMAKAIEDALHGDQINFFAFCPTAKGSPRWWDVSLTPVRDATGAITQVLSCWYDVSEKKRRERELEAKVSETEDLLQSLAQQLNAEMRRVAEARQQVHQTEKLRLLGQFVGHVVHDINNVLAVMKSAARLLRRRLNGQVESDILAEVDKSVDHGSKLVRRLLDFSRTGVKLAEVFDPAETIDADLDLLRHLAGKNNSLTTEIDAVHWSILAERHKLQSVVFNLVSNSRDAMPDGGLVTISIRNADPQKLPEHLAPGEYVAISVSDTGIGMSPEIVARAGEAFFSTKEEGKGTGLGLASAYELAEQSGGKVEIESVVGQGTTVTLYLPRGVETSMDVVGGGMLYAEGHGDATILVVKVDAAARRHIASILRQLNYVVLEASSEASALATVLREMTIDLVISDLNLQAMSGLRLADRLRQDHPDLPVIFIRPSADVLAPDGATSLVRPVQPSDLANAVLKELGRTRDGVTGNARASRPAI